MPLLTFLLNWLTYDWNQNDTKQLASSFVIGNSNRITFDADLLKGVYYLPLIRSKWYFCISYEVETLQVVRLTFPVWHYMIFETMVLMVCRRRRQWRYKYMASVNSCISVNHNLLNDNPKNSSASSFYNNVRKSEKFWDVTSLNFYIIKFWRWFLCHKFINRDDVFSKLSQYTLLQGVYLLVKF